ncbi:MAG: hypothetical protein AB1898_25225 [Acidobacteriota bacterium]
MLRSIRLAACGGLLMVLTWPAFSQSRILVLKKERTFPDLAPYITELLRAEGIVDYELKRFSELSPGQLGSYRLLILSAGSWSTGQMQEVKAQVEAGGNAILFLPGQEAVEVFGLAASEAGSPQSYIRFVAGDQVAQGLTSDSLQIHGLTARYARPNAQSLAWFGEQTTDKVHSAVSLWRIGKGRLVVFAFDLPWSIALTRQGNPLWANSENDGVPGLRPNDMFLHGKEVWIDPSKALIPQADEQMHFFARVVERLLPSYTLPRLWYFPGGAKAAVILTSDQEFGTVEEVEAVRLDMVRLQAPLTMYLNRPFGQGAAPSLSQYREQWEPYQLSLGAHFESATDWPFPTEDQMKSIIARDVVEFQRAYQLPMETTRMHYLRWIGWAYQARLLAEAGVGMDFTYVNLIPVYDGYLTGSGLPLRFVDQQGRVFDIFQQLTQYEDDVVISQMDFSAAWSVDEAVTKFARLLRASVDGHHTALTLNFHPPYYVQNIPDSDNSSKGWVEGCIAVAKEMEVPLLNATQWHHFVRARDQVRIRDLHIQTSGYQFLLEAPDEIRRLTLSFPLNQSELRVRIDDQPTPVSVRRIRTRTYALVTRDFKGTHSVTVAF